MINVGDRLPEGIFRVKQADGTITPVPVLDLFKGKKVVLIGVPGAFTSTCANSHVPQFLDNAAAIKAKGVERIVVMAVNDAHVMKAWGESYKNGGELAFVADGTGDYARALGLEVDLSGVGLGKRVRRFSMLVDDGVVKTLNVEPEGSRSVTDTGAATMLGQL